MYWIQTVKSGPDIHRCIRQEPELDGVMSAALLYVLMMCMKL